jgi:phosphoribosyl 1,2-cyclic phosphodiesterase/DNA-binding NarL/FixJ family response regulator
MSNTPAEPKRRILIADDVPGTVQVLSRKLQQRGYVVAHANDGEECLRVVRSFRPDLVVLDIMMPKIHGIDVLKAVRADPDPATRSIGFIVCSARSFTVDLKSIHDLGVYDFFDKALELNQLVEKVDAYFAGQPATSPLLGAAGPTTAGQELFRPSLAQTRGYWRTWGTRGSIPVSGPRVARHGGNTSCLEVRIGEHMAIIDAGSGIRDLGMSLLKEGPRKVPLLIGHTHWDHIQGFPFFTPAYIPGYHLDIYGLSQFGKPLESIFRGQLDRDYFPVEMQDMSARLEFLDLVENPLVVGPIQIYWEMMNHPGATVGFRIESEGTRVGYITDNEFLKGYLGSPYGMTAKDEIVLPYQRIIQFVANVDVLILEAQYTQEEYAKKVGWGHSSIGNACLLAKLAGARKLVITHHDPMHDDEFLERKLDLTKHVLRNLEHPIEVTNAYDGMTGYF